MDTPWTWTSKIDQVFGKEVNFTTMNPGAHIHYDIFTVKSGYVYLNYRGSIYIRDPERDSTEGLRREIDYYSYRDAKGDKYPDKYLKQRQLDTMMIPVDVLMSEIYE